ncbi:hypothetical protein CPSG_05205 [Coccidioides posadasii str. Silveira]|uniref:Uncharacterized protein n=1 Tax=Coccidioides posadasii (strain RMSCC 757 / Silveira) TaxID=443226 RepID=E9D4T7_COCPS|nr:hypothetical protein CPSG_05205 [Coccidioides posadasii str. Silveira]
MGRDPESVQRQKTPQTQESIAAQSLETRGSSHSCPRERLQRMLVDSWRCLASLGASLAIGVNMEYLPNILCGCDANNSRSGVRERKMLSCAQCNVARLVERVLTHRFLGKAMTPKRTNPRNGQYSGFLRPRRWSVPEFLWGLRRCGAIRKAIANPSHKHFFPIRDITFFDGSVARWASALLAI